MKKIKLVHILTDISSERERASIDHLMCVEDHGIKYNPRVNEIYQGDEWLDIVPITGGDPSFYKKGHYGAFQSFKSAFLEEFTEDLDAIIMCECDCILSVSTEDFVGIVNRGIDFCNKHSIKYLSLGNTHVGGEMQSIVYDLDDEFEEFQITTKVILAHCVVIPRHALEYFTYCFNNYSWESPDIWFNEAIWRSGVSSHAIIKKPVAFQHSGFSLIDQTWKDLQ